MGVLNLCLRLHAMVNLVRRGRVTTLERSGPRTHCRVVIPVNRRCSVVCVCVVAGMCVCVCVCVCARARARVGTHVYLSPDFSSSKKHWTQTQTQVGHHLRGPTPEDCRTLARVGGEDSLTPHGAVLVRAGCVCATSCSTRYVASSVSACLALQFAERSANPD